MSFASNRQSWPQSRPRKSTSYSAKERIDALEESLISGIEDDVRIGNGVPQEHRARNLDFVLMTGLTSPVAPDRPSRAPAPAGPKDMDPEIPVSFFEKGVDDVDSSIGPRAMETTSVEDDEIIVKFPPIKSVASNTVASLMDIIAEFTGKERPAVASEAAPVPIEPNHEAASPTISDAVPVEGHASPMPLAAVRTEPVASVVPIPDDMLPARAKRAVAETPAPSASELAELSPPPDLAEAGELMHALESNNAPLVDVHGPGARRFLTDWTFPEQDDPEDVLGDGEDRDGEHGPSDRRRSGGNNVRRRLMRWGFRVAVIALLGAGLYEAYKIYDLETATAAEVFAAAERLAGDGDHLGAASVFSQLVRDFPDSALRADAAFMAAHALQSVPADAGDVAVQAQHDAVIRFQQFVQSYPGHEKRARAETLLGMLYYKTGDYRNAISILSNTDRRQHDPKAYLPTLRTLARSYAALSEVENARSAFLRAASLDDNLAPDRDFIALADLYTAHADRAETMDARAAFLQAAVEQWDFALRVPSLLITRKRDISAKRDNAVHELKRQGYDVRGMAAADSPYKRNAKGETLAEQQLLHID